jgi:hypothetical protein
LIQQKHAPDWCIFFFTSQGCHFGESPQRGKLLVEQLELAIEDLEETQAEQETKAEIAAPEAESPRRRGRAGRLTSAPAT